MKEWHCICSLLWMDLWRSSHHAICFLSYFPFDSSFPCFRGWVQKMKFKRIPQETFGRDKTHEGYRIETEIQKIQNSKGIQRTKGSPKEGKRFLQTYKRDKIHVHERLQIDKWMLSKKSMSASVSTGRVAAKFHVSMPSTHPTSAAILGGSRMESMASQQRRWMNTLTTIQIFWSFLQVSFLWLC